MPAKLERAVKKIMATGKSKSQAYAIATAALQKSGYLKKGTNKLAKKSSSKKKTVKRKNSRKK